MITNRPHLDYEFLMFIIGRAIAGIYANNAAKAFQQGLISEYFFHVERFPITGSRTTGDQR